MAATTHFKKLDINLPNKKDNGKLAFVLLDVFTPEECQQFINLSEERGYSKALVNLGFRQALLPDVRNNDRCMIDDPTMAQRIFERIQPYLPNVLKDYQLVGLNERLRFLRYDPGQKFEPHYDGTYCRDDGSREQSFITVQLYLNEGFEGGETTFIHPDDESKNVPCVPRTGKIIIFDHDIYHEGSALKKGRKYTIRTDVMYKPIETKKTN